MLDEQKIPGRAAFFYLGPFPNPVFPAAASGAFDGPFRPVVLTPQVGQKWHRPTGNRAGPKGQFGCDRFVGRK
jgi:hypothetical protein